MKISFNKENNIVVKVDKTIELNRSIKKSIIKNIITREYEADEIHRRWGILYNVYDLCYNTDIRERHKASKHYNNKPIIDFMEKENKIDKLFDIAIKIYKYDLENYIKEEL